MVVPIITTLGADIGVHQMDSPYDRPGRWPKPKPPTDSAINKLLYKAMSLGMEVRFHFFLSGWRIQFNHGTD